jgi:hypothetical protein
MSITTLSAEVASQLVIDKLTTGVTDRLRSESTDWVLAAWAKLLVDSNNTPARATRERERERDEILL